MKKGRINNIKHLSRIAGYMLKYMAKNNERVFYSRGIPMYSTVLLAGSELAFSYCVVCKRRIKRYVILPSKVSRGVIGISHADFEYIPIRNGRTFGYERRPKE